MDHILCVVLLVLSCHIQASRAVKHLVVQKGSDVQLDVSEAVPGDFIHLVWTINGTVNIVSYSPDGKPKVFGDYTGRVEFSVTNYSVKLKNVQDTDRGDYTAVVTTATTDRTVAGYRVTVQAPVSPVNLTVASVSSSSDSCNLTVSCRTQDSHISTTFTCVRTSCSDDGDRSDTTTSGAVLHVYLENDSIKCYHSNQVSWTTNQGAPAIQHLCAQPSVSVSAGVSICLVKTVVFSVGLIIMTSAVVTVHLMGRIQKRKRPQEASTGVSTHTPQS